MIIGRTTNCQIDNVWQFLLHEYHRLGRESSKGTYKIHSDLQAASLEREEAITKPQPNEQNELSY